MSVTSGEAVQGVPHEAGVRAAHDMLQPIYPGSTKHTIVVVGGGVSGLEAIISIIERIEDQIKKGSARPYVNIMWFDSKGNMGPGSVYGDHEVIFELNVPVNEMSVFSSNQTHLLDWLKNVKHMDVTESSFIQRSVYAEYLRSVVDEIERRAAAVGVDIQQIVGEVHDVVKNGVGYKVYSGRASGQGGTELRANQIILAIGHMSGEDPFKGLLDGSDRYFNIINEDNFASVSNSIPNGPESHDKTILITGFGSTAVDRLRLLYNRGYEGKIVILTRHNMKPWAYRPEYNGKSGYELSLTSAEVEALAIEYVSAGGDSKSRKRIIERFTALIQKESELAQEKEFGPQNFINDGALMDIIDSDDLRRISPDFVARANKIIALFRANPTPPRDYKLIEQYLDQGRLQIIVGELEKGSRFEETSGKIHVSYESLEGEIKELDCDMVFHAAPFARDYRRHPFLQQLLFRGLVCFTRDAAALVECKESGELLTAEGIYAVGPFAVGSTTKRIQWGVETFNRIANRIGKTIVDRVMQTVAPVAANNNGRYPSNS